MKGRLSASLRTDCLPTFGVPAVNGGRPALSRRVLCQHRCRSAPNEHNVALSEMGLHGPQRLTAHYVGAAHRRALRGHLNNGERLAAGLSFSAPEAHRAAPAAVSRGAKTHRRSRRPPWRLRGKNLP
ncbi:hypothetical protein VY86_01740 [Photorhabdus thracensis]|uniref:Uncharacterized protein n=2 Tax=Photorhabdus thracensis TaxID=230089 RepID=A0A0F7LGH2_9GAMM|nr:hypothetical protein VY86_01740 [Photorhabdus thracensis]